MKKIEYSHDFKKAVRSNPKTIREFLNLRNEIDTKTVDFKIDLNSQQSFKKGKIIITPLYEHMDFHSFHDTITTHMKVEVGDASFFVKTIRG